MCLESGSVVKPSGCTGSTSTGIRPEEPAALIARISAVREVPYRVLHEDRSWTRRRQTLYGGVCVHSEGGDELT
jgi:hypothetical protein